MARSRLIVLFFLIHISASSCQEHGLSIYLPHILAVDTPKVLSFEVYESSHGVRGDGYTIEIYKFASSTTNAFLNSSLRNNLFINNPEWQRVNWTRSDTFPLSEDISDIAFNYATKRSELNDASAKARASLATSNCYLSILAKPNLVELHHLIIFIFDTHYNTMYLIDHNF